MFVDLTFGYFCYCKSHAQQTLTSHFTLITTCLTLQVCLQRNVFHLLKKLFIDCARHGRIAAKGTSSCRIFFFLSELTTPLTEIEFFPLSPSLR